MTPSRHRSDRNPAGATLSCVLGRTDRRKTDAPIPADRRSLVRYPEFRPPPRPAIREDDGMSESYTLEQYVHDLRTITAQESDPITITEQVAPLARIFAKSPGWIRPE